MLTGTAGMLIRAAPLQMPANFVGARASSHSLPQERARLVAPCHLVGALQGKGARVGKEQVSGDERQPGAGSDALQPATRVRMGWARAPRSAATHLVEDCAACAAVRVSARHGAVVAVGASLRAASGAKGRSGAEKPAGACARGLWEPQKKRARSQACPLSSQPLFLAAHVHTHAAGRKGVLTAARMSSTMSLVSSTSGSHMPGIVPRRRYLLPSQNCTEGLGPVEQRGQPPWAALAGLLRASRMLTNTRAWQKLAHAPRVHPKQESSQACRGASPQPRRCTHHHQSRPWQMPPSPHWTSAAPCSSGKRGRPRGADC